MKKRKKTGAAGKIFTALLVVLAAVVLGLLYYTRVIPLKYLIVATAVLLVLVVIIGILTWNFYHKFRFLLGLLLWFASVVALVLAAVYVYRTQTTLTDITGVKTEISRMGVYVKNENEAKTLEETGNYTYGILKNLDRANTDSTVAQINEQLNKEIKTKEYDSLGSLLDGLLKDETGAVIVNAAFLDVAKEMEGYENLNSMLRQVNSSNVETAVEEKQAEPATADPDLVQAAEDSGVYLIYISGIDNRDGGVAKGRSDINVLLAANTETKQILMVNIPRDYYVPLSVAGGASDKLTNAGIYGINASMDTLSMLFGADISHYLRMNVASLKEIVESTGGVSIETDGDFYSQKSDDQMAIIEEVFQKLSDSNVMNSYSDLLSRLAGSLETNISYEELALILQMQLDSLDSWNVVSCSVDGTEDTQTIYSTGQEASVIIPDTATVENAKNRIRQVVNGEILAA